MYLPNTDDYYQEHGTIKRIHPKKRKLLVKNKTKQKLSASEKRAFCRILKNKEQSSKSEMYSKRKV